MPGFSIRRVQWGPPPNLAPSAPARFIANQVKHRYTRNFTPNRFARNQATAATSETEAFIPGFLTHLRSKRYDTHPLAPPPIPSIHHLPFLYSRLVHPYKIVRARFFKLPKVEDPGPPATTRPLGFIRQNFKGHRPNLGAGYQFGALGGDAVGPVVDRPKFGFLRGFARRNRFKKQYSFRIWLPKPIIIPPTDKIYKALSGIPKPHKYTRPFTRFKYRARFVPTVTNFLSLIEFFNLRVRLDVKKAVDSGTVDCLAGDAGGTTVTFNRAFKDIDSIVTTVQETTEFITTVDFVDAPNPTSFKIFVYTTAGVRASKTVRWVARGII